MSDDECAVLRAAPSRGVHAPSEQRSITVKDKSCINTLRTCVARLPNTRRLALQYIVVQRAKINVKRSVATFIAVAKRRDYLTGHLRQTKTNVTHIFCEQ